MLDLISLQKLPQIYMSGRSICDAKHKVYNLLLQQFYFKSCGRSTLICPVHCWPGRCSESQWSQHHWQVPSQVLLRVESSHGRNTDAASESRKSVSEHWRSFAQGTTRSASLSPTLLNYQGAHGWPRGSAAARGKPLLGNHKLCLYINHKLCLWLPTTSCACGCLWATTRLCLYIPQVRDNRQ